MHDICIHTILHTINTQYTSIHIWCTYKIRTIIYTQYTLFTTDGVATSILVGEAWWVWSNQQQLLPRWPRFSLATSPLWLGRDWLASSLMFDDGRSPQEHSHFQFKEHIYIYNFTVCIYRLSLYIHILYNIYIWYIYIWYINIYTVYVFISLDIFWYLSSNGRMIWPEAIFATKVLRRLGGDQELCRVAWNKRGGESLPVFGDMNGKSMGEYTVINILQMGESSINGKSPENGQTKI